MPPSNIVAVVVAVVDDDIDDSNGVSKTSNVSIVDDDRGTKAVGTGFGVRGLMEPGLSQVLF